MHDGRPVNMLQRRACYFIIRGLLFLLAVVILWRMILMVRNPELYELSVEVYSHL